jgi:hypothetical protein
MTRPQDTQADRRSWEQEQPGNPVPGRSSEDPDLRRMLNSHVHCGEQMQLIIVHPAPPGDQTTAQNDRSLHTYRCACGFSFDQRRN